MLQWPLLIAAFIAGLFIGLIIFLIRRTGAHKDAELLRIKIAELETRLDVDADKIRWTEKAEANMRDAFEALASKALKDNASQLTERTKSEIDTLLNPLSKNLMNLETQVKEMESKRQNAYGSLSEQLAQLSQMNAALQNTTTTLTQALKSPTIRGRWGELQLRRVVEISGMSGHIDFDEQASAESGRPDMVVHLPNGGVLPIDSKAPLEAYLEAMESSDAEIRKAKLEQHARAMRGRIQDLGRKLYWAQFEKAPDFIVMFVPNESCLGAAFEVDPGLLEYAIENRILISSPVNLLALLRTVAYGWQQHQITENALRIANEGKELHKRIMNFADYLTSLGRAIKKSVDEYNAAIRSMERRMLPSIRRLEEMGVSTTELDSPREIETAPRLPAGEDSGESK